MVCLADPAVRDRARRDIKDMLDKRLTYRKEVLLENEIPPIPNVKRTPLELSRSPVYKRTKSMIPRKINKMLVKKSRRVLLDESNQSESPEPNRSFSVSSAYTDSDYDFGYYNRTKRRQSTTIRDLTQQLKETRRLLDVLKESEGNVPPPEEVTKKSSEEVTKKSVRRKIDMDHHESKLRRPQPKIADFVSAKELDCESIEYYESEELTTSEPIRHQRVDKEPVRSKFDVKSYYHGHDKDNEERDEESDLKEFEDTGKAISKRNLSGGSLVTESDPFTDSDYLELGVINLQDELDLSKGYESDRFSMCSEQITQIEARMMLSESEQRFSAILNSIEKEEDSFLENERLMQQHNISQLDDIISEPSSVEDLRFDEEELPLLDQSTDTGSTVTEKERAKVMLPSRQDMRDRPSLKFAVPSKREESLHLIQPTPLKPSAKPAKTKEDIDFNNYEKDLGEIENLLFKYDEYRMEQEIKKSDKNIDLSKEKAIIPIVDTPTPDKANSTQKPARNISDGIVPKTPLMKTEKPGTIRKDIKTGIAKGVPTKMTIRKPLTVSKPPSTATKPMITKPSLASSIKTSSKPLGAAIIKPKTDLQSKVPTIPKVSPKPVKKGLKEETVSSKTSTALAKPVPLKPGSPSKLAAKESANKTPTAVVSSPKVAVKPKSLSAFKNAPPKTKPTSSKTVGVKTSSSQKDVSTRKREEVGSKSSSPVKVNSSALSPTKEKSSFSKLSPPKTKISTPSSLKTVGSKGNYVQSAKLASIKSPGAKAPKDEPTTATKIRNKVDFPVDFPVHETKVVPKGTTPKALKSSPVKIGSSLKISPTKPSPTPSPSKIKSSPQKSQDAKESPSIKTLQQDIKATPTKIPPVKSPISKLSAAAKPLSTTKPSPATKPSLAGKAPSTATKLSSAAKPSLAPKPSLTAKSSPKRSASTETQTKVTTSSPVKSLSKPLSNPKGGSSTQKSSTIKTTEKPAESLPAAKGVITKTPQTESITIKGKSSPFSSVPSPSKVPTAKSGSSPTKISPAKTTPKSSFTPKITSTGTKASPNKPPGPQPQNEKDLSTGKTDGDMKLTSKLSPSKAGAVMKPVRSSSSGRTSSTMPTSNDSRKIGTSPKAHVGLRKPQTVTKASEVTNNKAKSSSEKNAIPTNMSLISEEPSTKTAAKEEENPSSKTITPAAKRTTKPSSKLPSPAKTTAKSPASSKSKVGSTNTKPDVSPKPKVSSKPDVSPKPKVSSKPDVSPKPKVSSKPDVSPKPKVSSKPDVSPKPKVLSKSIPVRGLQKPKPLK